MATEVLRPQDVLGERFRSFHRRRNFAGPNLIVSRKPNYNTGYKKTSPRSEKKKFIPAAENGGARKVTAAEPRRRDDGASGSAAVGQITLLRRGESLDSFQSKIKGGNPNPNPKVKSPRYKPVDDLAVSGTGRIGPNSPAMLPKQIRVSSPQPQPPPLDTYAGSAFSLSPSPRALPLPTFFSNNKKHNSDSNSRSFDDDSATRDLRRLLRLD